MTRNFTEADILVFHAQPYPDGLIIKTLQTLDLDVKLQFSLRLKNCWLTALNLRETWRGGWSIDKGQLKFIVSTFIQEMDIKSHFKENMPGDE